MRMARGLDGTLIPGVADEVMARTPQWAPLPRSGRDPTLDKKYSPSCAAGKWEACKMELAFGILSTAAHSSSQEVYFGRNFLSFRAGFWYSGLPPGLLGGEA